MKIVGIGLGIAGFIVGVISLFLPPMGVIDPSCLTFLGWVAVVIGILFAWDAVEHGMDTKVDIKDGSVSVTHRNEDND